MLLDLFKIILLHFIGEICNVVFYIKVNHRITLLFTQPGWNIYSKTVFCIDKLKVLLEYRIKFSIAVMWISIFLFYFFTFCT